jgi:hypothetical protein
MRDSVADLAAQIAAELAKTPTVGQSHAGRLARPVLIMPPPRPIPAPQPEETP